GEQGNVGLAELGVVEDVEELAAELHPELFGNLGVLQHREVQLRQAGTEQRVPSEIAEGTGRLDGEASRIEPSVYLTHVHLASANVVGTRRGGRNVAIAQQIKSITDRKRESAVPGHCSGELPALHYTVPVEWQVHQTI